GTAGQAEVEQHKTMPANRDGFVPEVPVPHPVYRHAGIVEGLYEGPAKHDIIFDHKNTHASK
ncbi:hypothetical protein RCCGEPOP_02661, partial [Rhizobium sp. Pop5]